MWDLWTIPRYFYFCLISIVVESHIRTCRWTAWITPWPRWWWWGTRCNSGCWWTWWTSSRSTSWTWWWSCSRSRWTAWSTAWPRWWWWGTRCISGCWWSSSYFHFGPNFREGLKKGSNLGFWMNLIWPPTPLELGLIITFIFGMSVGFGNVFPVNLSGH